MGSRGTSIVSDSGIARVVDGVDAHVDACVHVWSGVSVYGRVCQYTHTLTHSLTHSGDRNGDVKLWDMTAGMVLLC